MLDEPRAAAWVLAGLALVASLGLRVVMPSLFVASGMLGLLALWMLSRALQLHRLRLDIESRTYSYRRGWPWTRPLSQGTFDDIVSIYIDPNEATDGLAASQLRSRLITLELRGQHAPRNFVLGFPMGPRAAADKAADYG